MVELLEWSAFGIGTIGTVLWASGFKWRGVPVEGWFWLISALLWIWFAIENKHGGLAARDLLGVGLYVFGIVKVLRPTRIEKSIVPSTICQICAGDGIHTKSGPGTTTCKCQDSSE